MKRYQVLLFIFLIYGFAAAGQPGKQEDVLYLNNESIIRGTIIDSNSTRIKIQTSDGSIWVYPASSILRVAREQKFGNYRFSRKGFGHFTELGPLIAGRTSQDGVTTAAFSLQTVNGYRFSPRVFAGIGAGADLYATQTIIPLFASLRGDISEKGTVIPFYVVEGGFGIDITQISADNKHFKGGALYAAGVGVKIPFNRNAGFLLSIAYRYQLSAYLQNDQKKELEYRRLAVRAGFFL